MAARSTAHSCTSSAQPGEGEDCSRWRWIFSESGLAFKQQMGQICNRSMDWDCRCTKQCKHSICCCNRVLIGTGMQPSCCSSSCTSSIHVVTSLPKYTWELCWLSSALCLIKIESLLEWLQSAKTSKERLVKLQGYLQTQRNKIFFYCHNWKSVPACHGRNMCKELFYLPMFCPALKSYPSLQINIPRSSLTQLLWQQGTSTALKICFSSSVSTVQKHQL